MQPATLPAPEVANHTVPRRSGKTIYTLTVNNYAPRVTHLTMPLLRHYAKKIGADLVEIKDRRFSEHPGWPINIEKFQVGQLAAERGDEWSVFIDADALVSPEMFDVTAMMPKDTMAHNGRDMANMRFMYDKYFLRDKRHYGSCTWFVAASEWTVEDLWRFPELDPDECWKRINITIDEHNSNQCHANHLIDDYTLSRNIARFGLKATTLIDICAELGYKQPDGRGYNPFLWHIYNVPEETKLTRMLNVLSTPNRQIIPGQNGQPQDMGWGLMDPKRADELRAEWKLPKR